MEERKKKSFLKIYCEIVAIPICAISYMIASFFVIFGLGYWIGSVPIAFAIWLCCHFLGFPAILAYDDWKKQD